jgi:hypothetical protein
MLLTYAESLSIPNKQHLFYEFAFNALFYKHDSQKEGVFERHFYSKLPQDDFRSVFGCFCALTYAQQQLEFTADGIIDAIKSSLATEKIRVNPLNFLKDLCESTSLIVRDGLSYEFVHRSFQEYFTARFLAENDYIDIRAYIDSIIWRSHTDNVVKMAADIAFAKVERLWIVPTIEEILDIINDIDITDDAVKYAKVFYNTIHISETGVGLGYNSTNYPYARDQIMKFYPRVVKRGKPRSEKEKQASESFAKAFADGMEINDEMEPWLQATAWSRWFEEERKSIQSIKEYISKERQSRIETLQVFMKTEGARSSRKRKPRFDD